MRACQRIVSDIRYITYSVALVTGLCVLTSISTINRNQRMAPQSIEVVADTVPTVQIQQSQPQFRIPDFEVNSQRAEEPQLLMDSVLPPPPRFNDVIITTPTEAPPEVEAPGTPGADAPNYRDGADANR